MKNENVKSDDESGLPKMPCSASLIDAAETALLALKISSKRHDKDRGTEGMWEPEIKELEEAIYRERMENMTRIGTAGSGCCGRCIDGLDVCIFDKQNVQ